MPQYSKNHRLKELINASCYDEDAVLQFARDCSPDWNSKEHWDIIKAIWKLNKTIKPACEKMNLIGLPDDVDMPRMHITAKTKPISSLEFQATKEFQDLAQAGIRYDTSMAQHVEEEILAKGQKGLVFVGIGHDWTQYQYPKEVLFGVDLRNMGCLLKSAHGDLVCQVRVQCSADPRLIDKVMKLGNHQHVGFKMQDSPFVNVLVPVGKGASDVLWSKLADGYIYLGPRDNLSRNTSLDGFVTERMFEEFKQYYEVAYGHSFVNAKEVDEYLQRHRWPSANR